MESTTRSGQGHKTYRTETRLRRMLRVRYPAGAGRMVLRTELDWDKDVNPIEVSDDGETTSFALEAQRPHLYLKPCLRTEADGLRWSVGPNVLFAMTGESAQDLFPYFEGPEAGSFTPILERESAVLSRRHLVRVYLPPGYHENPLRTFPVLYMQDGKNLFFPEEAFLGREWHVDEALQLLDAMNAVDRVVVVGIYSGDRNNEYTKPGYAAYARAVVEEVKPEVDSKIRVFRSPRETGVIGSSLGGVVSFYMAWEHPDVFGYAACMSSTFSHQDDLIDRVLSEPKHSSKFYLDSGWPGDNYEVTLAMAMALTRKGYRLREDFLHLAFPLEEHDERAWGRRLHIPLQLGFGHLKTSLRGESA